MTIFGWDASHYDGNLTVADLTKAKAEGIAFFTHKIGEGLTNVDETAAGALSAARAAGIPAIGGYYFIHSGDMEAQADRCIALADRYVPWWKTFGGWFWQTDAETDTGGHLPSPAEVKRFSDRLAVRSGRLVIVYASHGQYGNRLAGLGHPLWNANYPTSRKAPFKALYPGDSYAGWTAYSGQTPVFAQYTSSATIAGHTTCDANGYRGTVAQLLALIGAPAGGASDPVEETDMALTDDDVQKVAAATVHLLLTGLSLPVAKPTMSAGSAMLSGQQHAASADAKLDAIAEQLTGLPAAVVAALPPTVGVTSVGDFTVTGTVHVDGAPVEAP